MVRARRVRTVANLAELRATTRHDDLAEIQRLDVQDTLRFDADSLAVDDGVGVVKPDNLLVTQKGRWLKVFIDADDVTGGAGLTAAERQALYATFQPRMERANATTVDFTAVKGRLVGINGEMVNVSAFQLVTTDNIIDGNGDEVAATPMIANTEYSVYVSNSQASFAPLDFKASLTPPTLVNTGDISNTFYLGAAGNALNWRFVGRLFTDGSTQIEDNQYRRHVANFYNVIYKSLLADPGYQDNGSSSSYTETSTSYVLANSADPDASLSFVSNGGEGWIESHGLLICHPSSANHVPRIGIGEDSTSDAKFTGIGNPQTGSEIVTIPVNGRHKFAAGRHQLHLLIQTNAGTMTVFADLSRAGSAADPIGTHLEALVPV